MFVPNPVTAPADCAGVRLERSSTCPVFTESAADSPRSYFSFSPFPSATGSSSGRYNEVVLHLFESGVAFAEGLLAGLALVLRDAVQSLLGNRATIAAILCGTLLSGLLSDPAVVIGSAAAFLFSELADFLVYTPLRRRYPSSAILVSGLVGSIVDSCIFLQLAFGSLEFVTGQVVGKFWMSLAAAALLYLWRRRRAAHAEGGAFA